MARTHIIQCDICGEQYEGYHASTWNEIWGSKIIIDDFGKYTGMSEHNRQEYDLCIKCMTRVRNFFNHMQTNVEVEEMVCKPCNRKCPIRKF